MEKKVPFKTINNDEVMLNHGIGHCSEVALCTGVAYSKNLKNVFGASYSENIQNCYATHTCSIVQNSKGVVNSTGVFKSMGVVGSFGVYKCRGISHSLFVYEMEGASNIIFNKQVTSQRFTEVMEPLIELKAEWISKLESIEPAEAWKSMPSNILEYIKSLPEFDPEIFKDIIEISNRDELK